MAVHRYKANESSEDDALKAKKASPAKSVKKATKATAKKEVTEKKPKKIFVPFRGIKHYFTGSWRELRQVRWPNRKQTWALTLAVILFSLFFGVLIFLLDAGFTLLFKKFIF